ncbi:TPA: ferredoxin [candidate division CPR2 bacterium]|uniref:Ferredoxin n=1 Tax=candidate division CPR2 bacterium GW2011_GWC1_41_48 TaxID=1618344 RepID=A0A0G0WAB2_UNCC2|nr:MAG: Ferredoxin [candidate division CPR2 bacterium GW2011_GWC2_39_35]KKR29357.1 MAG: Ferredoxin [candidate division CPR2 bacterium GW2011_GWD2_39_7]KKS09012.1 MAG: Ferredoxin [candidate division CPR2 bacterium GW2011_GWC1_41_48]OGB71179.1 MAG: hypothetical protein A2Y26_04175 [candidate division CPR2 bacterium GWD2_39_7]HBG81913.1 ferredoxin [candidate division CPR2 bacterium]
MKVTVDQNLCIGCGVCVNSCEEVFELRDDNKCHVKAESCNCESCDLNEIAESCPAGAIEVEE